MSGVQIIHRTRSVRLRVYAPDGRVAKVENLRGEGPRVSAQVARRIHAGGGGGSASVELTNVESVVLDAIVNTPVARGDAEFRALFGDVPFYGEPLPSGGKASAAALGVGYAELELGYDGAPTQVAGAHITGWPRFSSPTGATSGAVRPTMPSTSPLAARKWARNRSLNSSAAW